MAHGSSRFRPGAHHPGLSCTQQDNERTFGHDPPRTTHTFLHHGHLVGSGCRPLTGVVDVSISFRFRCAGGDEVGGVVGFTRGPESPHPVGCSPGDARGGIWGRQRYRGRCRRRGAVGPHGVPSIARAPARTSSTQNPSKQSSWSRLRWLNGERGHRLRTLLPADATAIKEKVPASHRF